MRAVNIVISGRVQGVFFRHTAQTKAKELGITGTATNQSDGSVLIEAEGKTSSIEQFMEWCRIGSPSAKVDSVHIAEITPRNYQEFSIK